MAEILSRVSMSRNRFYEHPHAPQQKSALAGRRCGYSQRFAAFVEDVQIGVVHEHPVAALAGQFAGDAQIHQY